MKLLLLLALLVAGCVKRVEPAPRTYGVMSVMLSGPPGWKPTTEKKCTYRDRVYRGDKQMCAELKKIIQAEAAKEES